MKLPISDRLRCCAAQVPQGSRVADIGADHGYLGIFLLQTGQAKFVHASELREGPLHRAMENAVRYGVAEKMRFSQADGLAAVDPDEIDTVVCAGMGGDLITQIISVCPWLRDPRYLLILQPQSSGADLRRALAALGFGTEKEALVRDGGFLYQVLSVRYGCAAPLTPGAQYVSPALLASGDPLLPDYLARIERSLALTAEGIRRGGDPADESKLHYYEAALREVREMRRSYENRSGNP